MDRIHSNEMNYWRNFFTRCAIVVVTVALIVWFMPREEGQQFRYGIDKPWTYGSVIAKFDFPIYKTDETSNDTSPADGISQDEVLDSFTGQQRIPFDED